MFFPDSSLQPSATNTNSALGTSATLPRLPANTATNLLDLDPVVARRAPYSGASSRPEAMSSYYPPLRHLNNPTDGVPDKDLVTGTSALDLNAAELTGGPVAILAFHPTNFRLFPALASYCKNFELWTSGPVRLQYSPLASSLSSGAVATAFLTPEDTQGYAFFFPAWSTLVNVGTTLLSSIAQPALYALRDDIKNRLATWLMEDKQGNGQTTPGTIAIATSPETTSGLSSAPAVMPACTVHYAFRFSGFRPQQEETPDRYVLVASTEPGFVSPSILWGRNPAAVDSGYFNVAWEATAAISYQKCSLLGAYRGPVQITLTWTTSGNPPYATELYDLATSPASRLSPAHLYTKDRVRESIWMIDYKGVGKYAFTAPLITTTPIAQSYDAMLSFSVVEGSSSNTAAMFLGLRRHLVRVGRQQAARQQLSALHPSDSFNLVDLADALEIREEEEESGSDEEEDPYRDPFYLRGLRHPSVSSRHYLHEEEIEPRCPSRPPPQKTRPASPPRHLAASGRTASTKLQYAVPKPWEPSFDEGFCWLQPVAGRSLLSDGVSVFCFNEETEEMVSAPRAPYAVPGDVLAFYRGLGILDSVARRFAVVSYIRGIAHLQARPAEKDVDSGAFAMKLASYGSVGSPLRRSSSPACPATLLSSAPQPGSRFVASSVVACLSSDEETEEAA